MSRSVFLCGNLTKLTNQHFPPNQIFCYAPVSPDLFFRLNADFYRKIFCTHKQHTKIDQTDQVGENNKNSAYIGTAAGTFGTISLYFA